MSKCMLRGGKKDTDLLFSFCVVLKKYALQCKIRQHYGLFIYSYEIFETQCGVRDKSHKAVKSKRKHTCLKQKLRAQPNL